ncbi:uncharacterized protein LOC116260553 [Nymphaea colorata]|nr:uncharacterized protein LOC116260553 [Nymphaea colorata]
MLNHEKARVLGRSKSRRWRQGRTGVTISVSLVLLLATGAWLSLVFSGGSRRRCWHKLKEWEGSPRSFPWQPDEVDASAGSFRKTSGPVRDGGSGGRDDREDEQLSLRHIEFGIAGSAQLWSNRKEFVRLWWRPEEMIGHVWLEEVLSEEEGLPPIRVSEDISRFSYTNPTGHPSGLRISRIVKESFRLGLPGVRWFVLGDDDTIFNPDNLVRVLAKYDHNEMVYIGGPSESHSANTYFSHSMAFGGGGIAISYPLAESISKMQDECLERYPKLYGSDDRLHACISELGVPLTREYGFHQWDIRGSAHGLLSAHPVAPFISIHHVEAVDPIYPGLNLLDSLKLFARAMKVDPLSFLQRSVCYDRRRRLTFAVSLGYVVQVFPNIVLPRDLERSEQTYMAWNRLSSRNEFDFDTRDSYRSTCKKPVLFFLRDVRKAGNSTLGTYTRTKGKDELKRRVLCFPRTLPLREVKDIQVIGKPLSENWHLYPRRLCCQMTVNINNTLRLAVGQCERGKLSSVADIL